MFLIISFPMADEEEQDLPEAVNNPAAYENRRFVVDGL